MMDLSETMNSHVELPLVYQEEVVPVEFVPPEPQECIVCVTQNSDSANIFTAHTTISRTPLHAFLSRFTNTELPFCPEFGKYICRKCLHLVNVLEKAEIEYVKLKTTFALIINRNPLFHLPVRLETLKEQEPLYSGDDEPHPMAKNTEVCISVEEFPQKISNESNTVFVRAAPSDVSDGNSTSEEIDTGKSFYGETTDDEYCPNGKQRTQAKVKKTGPKCTICRRRFSCKRNLQRHLQIHYDKKSYDCHLCQRRFNVHAHLRAHLKTHNIYECGSCQFQFTSKDMYETHLATHEGEERPYACKMCPRRFTHVGQLRYHARVHAPGRLEHRLSENGEAVYDDDVPAKLGETGALEHHTETLKAPETPSQSYSHLSVLEKMLTVDQGTG